ncbi:MAG TPA: tetratricopeptide repeat protein [Geothrix sp.]|jgi:tetratricopeptide (TPR) repeat protein
MLPGLSAVAQAPPPLEGETYRLAEEAYRRQQAGDLPGALRAADGALALAPEHPQLLGLKQDLLFAAGSLEEADALNRRLLERQPGDPRLRLFRIYLRQRQGRLAEALQDAAQLADLPGIPADSRRQARLAMADLLQAQKRPAEALAALDPLKEERTLDVQSRRAFLMLAAGQPELACPAFEGALGLAPDPAQRRTLLLGLRDASRTAKRPDGELKALQDLRAQDPADRGIALDLAYAFLARHRDPEALDQFSAALDAQSPPGAWLDAGYAAKRLGRNADAARFFSRGLDARDAAGQRNPELDYGLRREVEGLNRTWGLVSGTAYRQGGLLPGIASQQKILQQGLEAYWQPEFFARNGRMIQVFAQAFETLYSGSPGTTGGPTVQGVVGVRAKPLASENLVLTAQKLIKLGRYSQDDWMFRAAYSRDEGMDLRPWQDDWTYWTLYTEGAAFARTGHYIHQGEIRAGHAWRLPFAGGRDVIAPHLVLAGDFDNRLDRRYAGGVGLGASLRHWFREDRHQAPASWLEFTLQGRAQLTGASRGGGLFLTLTCWF